MGVIFYGNQDNHTVKPYNFKNLVPVICTLQYPYFIYLVIWKKRTN